MASEKNNSWKLREQRVGQLKQLKPGSRVHVSGVCGTGTSAVALLLKEKGFIVSGSDKAFYPPMDTIVRKNCDVLYESFSPENISKDLDFVVIGNALGANNCEVEKILELGLPYCSMPDVFEAFLIGTRQECPASVVVAGTHGKTTTTALTAWLFESAGRKPGYFLGGIPGNFASHIRPVSKDQKLDQRVVVLEGDEYDSAFFAKWPKFHSYRPDILLVTSLEFDHADIYQSVDDIRKEFLTTIKAMDPAAVVLFWIGSSELIKLRDEMKKLSLPQKILFYGEGKDLEFSLRARKILPGNGQRLSVSLQGEDFEFDIPSSGQHNALNALAAAAVGKLLGLKSAELVEGFKTFKGVKRRQQILFEDRNLLLLEDFAHHPTAVKTTLSGLAEQYPNRRLVALFEPRSNTSRRNLFQDSYAKSFVDADLTIIQDVANEAVYSAFDEKTEFLRVDLIVEQLKKQGKLAYLCKDPEEIYQKLNEVISAGDVVVLMSNGAFGGLPARLKKWAEIAFL